MNDNQQAQFAMILAVLLAAAALFTYFWFQDLYTDIPSPEDCSLNYEYPLCARAGQPGVAPPPAGSLSLAGLLLAGLLAVLFAVFGYKASVTQGKGAPPSASGPAARQQEAGGRRQEGGTAGRQEAGRQGGTDAWGHPVPPAIPLNTIPQGAVVQPMQQAPLQQSPQQQGEGQDGGQGGNPEGNRGAGGGDDRSRGTGPGGVQ